MRAEVVRGFGRGSRDLGFPTANLKISWDALASPRALGPEERAVLEFAESDTGIYCALATVEDGPDKGVYKVAMSLGWNPTFKDVKAKVIEPWILHKFEENFYGCHLRLLVLGYIRPEVAFESVDELIKEIQADGDFCAAALDSPSLAHFRDDIFLHPTAAAPAVGAPVAVAPAAEPSTAAQADRPPLFAACVQVGGGLVEGMRGLPSLRPRSTRLLLVRHGESVANEAGRLSGGGDDSELSALGHMQAEALAVALSCLPGFSLAAVGASPLRRAAQTAEKVARAWPAAEVVVIEALREMRYGALEGAPLADAVVRGEIARLAAAWRGGGVAQCIGGSGGESPQDVATRAMSALERILRQHPGGTVLLVCHAWVAKAFLASVSPDAGLQRLLEVPQRNCAVNVVDFSLEDSRFEVLRVDLVASEPQGRL